MKVLKNYNGFVTEKLKMINEGGGAGKDLIFDDVNFQILLEYSDKKLTLIKKELDLGDKLDIIGYDDGMRDIKIENLFEEELNYVIDLEKLSNLTVKKVNYYSGQYDEYPDEMTLGEISENEKIQIEISGSGEFSYMLGAGWMHVIIEKDDVVFDTSLDLHDDYDSYIDDINIYDCLGANCDLDVTIKLVATEEFENLWSDLFDSSNFENFKEETMKSEEDEGEDHSDDEWYWQMWQDDLDMKYGL